MKKVLTLSTAILLVLMVIAAYFLPEQMGIYVASNSIYDDVVRLTLAASLAVLAATARPRNVVMRSIFGGISAGTLLFALAQTVDYHLSLFDSLVYFCAAAILIVEATEVRAPALHQDQEPITA